MKIKKQKRKLKFEDYENCLKAGQIENKTNNLQKNKTDVDSLKKDFKKFIKMINEYLKHNKGLEDKSIMFLLKKLTRLF